MRGDAERQADIMLAVTLDSFVPDDHPIRCIKPIASVAEPAVRAYVGRVRASSSPAGRS